MNTSSLSEFLGKKVGVLGGGQLGKMMSVAAHRLGLKLCVMDSSPDCPCAGFVDQLLVGAVSDPQQVLRFKEEGCVVVTVETEHVNVESLRELEKSGIPVFPSSHTLAIIQDKFVQHEFLRSYNIAVTDFVAVDKEEDVHDAIQKFGLPLLLKARRQSYDGRGNFLLKTKEQIEDAFQKLGRTGLYAEKFVPFVKELSVMVAIHVSEPSSVDPSLKKNKKKGEEEEEKPVAYCFPVVETFHSDNICNYVVAPAMVSKDIIERSMDLAKRAASSFNSRGIFGVELFLLEDGSVLVNEIAPRPHNSGHYSIEATDIDQFEAHIRSILNLTSRDPTLVVPASIMVNILGRGSGEEVMKETLIPIQNAFAAQGARSHWYGKKEVRKDRKMGHITITGQSTNDIAKVMDSLNLPDFSNVKHLLKAEPVVGIIMGSDSDLPKMKAAGDFLKKFGVPFEVTIVSAHRTPSRMFTYATEAASRGIKVIIAGAGGAAHLPGMVAAITPLPVIGVPISLSVLDGQDSLHSIVQMPRGVPVATVAINNSTNAGLLAVRILGAGRMPHLLDDLQHYREEMRTEVMAKVDRMEKVGWENY
eukprot:TRINITY_DN4309_c0_g1_i1.p1 TRINITY_DN4309_c0_g1~~TRINITY_DN4309_c0_g1_i1.p1  ORF type:complete len:587 (+),score=139.98 TRINITY_DN4309_c0_g1_i1:301-2061(+)